MIEIGGMNNAKVRPLYILFVLFIAGALGGFTNSIVVWSLGASGITPSLGFSMAPDFTVEWIARRIFASGLWGVIFLIPLYDRSPIKKGVILSVLPWLSSVLFIFPFRMEMGWFGLDFGLGAPLWTLIFAAISGVTGTVFLSKLPISIRGLK